MNPLHADRFDTNLLPGRTPPRTQSAHAALASRTPHPLAAIAPGASSLRTEYPPPATSECTCPAVAAAAVRSGSETHRVHAEEMAVVSESFGRSSNHPRAQCSGPQV